jgi:hypothetical protein
MSAANVGRSLSRLAAQQAHHRASLRSVHLSAANIPLAKYGGRHTVTMLPGDGIGPEMMDYLKGSVFNTYFYIPVPEATSVTV